MTEPLVVDFDHHRRTFLDNRLQEWQALRRTPVAYTRRHGGYWVVSGYKEVARVSREEAVFTSFYGERDGVACHGIAGVPRPPGIPSAGIAEADEDVHAALRRVLNPFLLPPAVARLEPLARSLATWFLDQRIEQGAMDLVADFANPVPAVITMRMIGLPGDDWTHYAELFHASVAFGPGSAEFARAMARVPEMMAGVMAEAARRRRDPREDMLSAIVHLETEAGRRLTDDEIVSVLWNLIGGGLDTTTSLTSLSLHYLASHPEARDRLIEDRSLLPVATEEFLRYFSVNETLTRTVTCPVELGGQRLGPGDVVLLSWLSANHDESVFPEAATVVVDRAPNRHLAFGVGPHRCIGMHVARSLFQVMVDAVLDRIPDYEVNEEGTRFYEGNPILAGAVAVPVRFKAGPRVGPTRRPF